MIKRINIEFDVFDANRNFDEILDPLKEFISRRDGIRHVKVYEKEEILKE